jgi:hypothetical protein
MAAIDTTEILTDIYSFMVADSSFNTSIGGDASTNGRLWWDKAEPDETLPYAVMTAVDWVKANVMATDGCVLRLQVAVYVDEASSTAAALTAIIDNLLDRMQRASITITNHENTTPAFDIMRGPVYDDDTIRMDADFLLEIIRTP